jgi:hypothetical protein
VAVAVQVFDDRQQAVDLVLREVAEVLDAHQTERLRRQADLEQRRSGEVEERDPALPPDVQELGQETSSGASGMTSLLYASDHVPCCLGTPVQNRGSSPMGWPLASSSH